MEYRNFFIKFFKNLKKNKEITIISHNDTDGIVSSFIISEFFKKENIIFFLKNVKNFQFKKLKKNIKYLFLDLGSSHLIELKDQFIIDHHQIKKKFLSKNHIYPEKINSKFGCTSSLSFKLIEENSKENIFLKKLRFWSFIGIIGDMQKIKGINKEILKKLLNDGILEKRKELDLFGLNSKKFLKLIYFNYRIKKISYLEFKEEIGFLLNINPIFLENLFWMELIEEDKKKIIFFLKKILKIPIKKKILLFTNFLSEISIDIREISTSINCLGRYNQFKLARYFLKSNKNFLEDKKMKILLEIYRKTISSYIKSKKNYFFSSEKINGLILSRKYRETILGVLCGISSRIEKKNFLIIHDYLENKDSKFSIRIFEKTFKLKNLWKFLKKNNFICGGHDFAGGGFLKKENEKNFLKIIKSYFK